MRLIYLFKELRRHLWRTVAGISGYAIAILFILLIISVTKSNEKDSLGILKGTGTHFIVYVPSNVSCCVTNGCSDGSVSDGSLIAEGGYAMMLNSDLIGSIKEIEGVRDAAPYLLYKAFDETYKTGISLGGIDTSSLATRNNVCAATNLISGRYLSDRPDEVIAEESFAMAYKLAVGDTLKTYGGKLVLTGIVNSGIKPGKADLYASIDNVRSILKNKLNCISDGFDMNIVLVEVSDARIQKKVIDQLKAKLSYLSVSSYNCYQPASDVMTGMESASSVLAFLIFFFLVIFSAKTQFTSLMERFREIGILKSLGWSNSTLGSQVIFISVFQALTGAITGIIAGWLMITLMNSLEIIFFNNMKFQFQASVIPVLLLLSLAGGLLAGIFPIIRLFRTKAGEMINNYM